MRILVVEDERKISDFIKRGLKEDGYTVETSLNGVDGYNMALSEKFDLVILDIMLPDKDGVAICRDLRRHNINTPIMMLTAKNAVQDKVTGLDAGADDYLTKPFAFEEFLARVRALLRKKNKEQVTVLKIDDLELDLISHKVTRSGMEITLTTKEFSLLEYMMRNAGSIITRTMITEHVWEINFESFTNIIDVYINYLRNKIDKNFDNKLIHTVRGRGYMIKG